MSGIVELIPAFDWQAHMVEPWADHAEATGVVVLMGFLVSAACGLVGNYLVLRKLSLVGDAISHSLLPGIALAFLLAGTRTGWPVAFGAVVAGVLTVVLIEAIHRNSRVKADAAIGITFSTLFAVGVVLISVYADKVDLDADCVLYGEIAYIPLEDRMTLPGTDLAIPVPVVRMAGILALVLLGIGFFFKELMVTSFDPGLANSLGIRSSVYHYGLMIVLSLVIVGAFEAVGAILVIAMLIFPGATSMLLTDRLGWMHGIAGALAVVYAIGGFHLAMWLNASIAGCMVLVAGLCFGVAWLVAPRKGLVAQLRRQLRNRSSSALPDGPDLAEAG